MIVLVPYVPGMLHPRVVPAIRKQGYLAFTSEVGAEGLPSYPEWLADLFGLLARGLDCVTIVEQDVESMPGLLKAYEDCAEPWCYSPYDFSVPFDEAFLNRGFAPLGHTKFRQEIADLLVQATRSSLWWHRPEVKEHEGLDYLLSEKLKANGYQPHAHPRVQHWHHYGR